MHRFILWKTDPFLLNRHLSWGYVSSATHAAIRQIDFDLYKISIYTVQLSTNFIQFDTILIQLVN